MSPVKVKHLLNIGTILTLENILILLTPSTKFNKDIHIHSPNKIRGNVLSLALD